MQARRVYTAVCVVWAAAAAPVWAQEAGASADNPPEAQAAMSSEAPEAPKVPAEALQAAPTSAMLKTSYALWGVSGATVLTGTVFALLANSNHRRYKRDYSLDADTRVIHGDADPLAARKLKDKIGTQKTVSIVSFSVAAAAAIGGTTLFFLSPEWQAKKAVRVGLAPIQGGALLSLQGVFP